MSKSSQVQIDTSTPTEVIDTLKDTTMGLSDTSKKIRYLTSQGKSVKEVYHLLQTYGVTTKDGKEIRYQHVRNVVMTKLSTN